MGVFLSCTAVALLSNFAGESVGLLVSAGVPDFEESYVVLVIIAVLMLLTGGFFAKIIPGFISWIKYLSPFKYAIDATRQIVFNKSMPCDGSGKLELCIGDVEFITPSELIETLHVQGSIGFNIGMLVVLFILPDTLPIYSSVGQRAENVHKLLRNFFKFLCINFVHDLW